MPRAKAVTLAQWPQYLAALGDPKPIRFEAGHKQTIAQLVAPSDVVWMTQRLQEFAGIIAQTSRGDALRPSVHAELAHVRQLLAHAEAVEKGLRELWPSGRARRLAEEDAARQFDDTLQFWKLPAPPTHWSSHLRMFARFTAESLRVAERKLSAAAKRGTPPASVVQDAVELTARYAVMGRVSEDPEVIASLAEIMLDAAGAPNKGRTRKTLLRYAKAALAKEAPAKR